MTACPLSRERLIKASYPVAIAMSFFQLYFT